MTWYEKKTSENYRKTGDSAFYDRRVLCKILPPQPGMFPVITIASFTLANEKLRMCVNR